MSALRIPNPALEAFRSSPGEFVVYGTGRASSDVTSALAAEGIKPSAYADTYRTGSFDGLPILEPEVVVEMAPKWVVTASMYARDMAGQLRGDGYEGPVIDLTVAHQDRWAHHFDTDRLDADPAAIARTRSLLADTRSQDVFDAVLRHRRTLEPEALPPELPAYTHPRAAWLPGETVIDAGAFDGATSLDFAHRVGREGRVHALEPSARNVARLEDAVAGSAEGGRVVVHALGCWERSGVLALGGDEDDPSQLRVAERGERIRVTSIDELVRGHRIRRVDWIKLDVEGAEREALLGAEETLASHRPKLAVCVYHRPDDLWQIPSWLAERDYVLFLGHHGQNLYDTVCYAVPRESLAAGETDR